ncbi:MAG: tetratricopeptide repeat protein [Bacteroidia bacterium]
MKTTFTAIILSLFFLRTVGQGSETDSLKQRLTVTKEDTVRVQILNRLSKLYRNTKLDTSLLFAKQGLQLARNAGFTRGEAECMNSIGNVFLINGNYPNALETYLKMLKIYEKLNNQKGIGVSMANVALIYVEQGDYRQALSYYFKSKEIFDTAKTDPRLIVNLLNIGDTYEKLNLLDSALQFTQQGYELAVRTSDKEYIGMALNNLGNIHAKMEHMSLAMEYYRLSIPYSLAIDDKYVFGETYLAMAKLFKQTSQTDSSYYYAKRALEMGKSISGHKFIMNAAQFLAENYEKQHRIDSAYYYSKIAGASRDSLFSEEKIKQVQALNFSERLRQMEIAEAKADAERKMAEAKALAEKARKNNLQLMGISVFIVVFFLFIILLSRKKTKSRFVEFMGLLGLLLLFEFISLFIHPYVGVLTHHSPVLMLLILVCVASVLVPTHHYLVKMVKQKLAHKIILLPDAAAVQTE